MAISASDVSLILEKLDFLNLIQEHVPLKRVGSRYVGLCPFHSESSASFSVNPTMGVYYCFGCHASGDAITFVRNLDRLDFAGAVEYLAQRVGITITHDSPDESRKRNEQKKVREILEKAVEFYQANLAIEQYAFAKSYVDSRGITQSLIDRFRIGVAPSDPLKLSNVLRVSNDQFVAAGLGYVDSNGRARDMFAGRLVFPIFDQGGQPLGFGGRVIPGASYPGESEPAKYKNSPETQNYSKRRVLYGLNWAKSEIVHQDRAVICEGYTDVVAFFGAGLPIAVATCGTALTEEHVDRLKNFSKNIILAFDGDKAGSNATERIYEWERKFSLNVRVASFPLGEDPSSVKDPQLLHKAIDEARPFLAFRVERVISAKDLSSIEGRVLAADAALELVAEHPNALVRGQYLMMVADLCKLEAKELQRTLDRLVKRVQSRQTQGYIPQIAKGDHPQNSSHDDIESAPVLSELDDPHQGNESVALNQLFDGAMRPYNEALRKLLQGPEGLISYMPEYLFSNPVHLELVRYIREHPSRVAITSNTGLLSATARALMMRLIAVQSDFDEVDVIARLVEHHAGRIIDNMVRQIRNVNAEHEHDPSNIIHVSETMTYIRSAQARLRDYETRDAAVTELLEFFATVRE